MAGLRNRSKATGRPHARNGSGASLPGWVEPQIPTSAAEVPEGADWLHEVKQDGYRILAFLQHGEVRLLSRTRRDLTRRFASVAGLLQPLAARSIILDGEIAAPDEHGLSHGVEGTRNGKAGALVYFVFDLLWIDDDLRERQLLYRKRRLEALLGSTPKSERVRYLDYVTGSDGPRLYGEVVKLGGEGIVSKRKRAHYRGGPSDTWLTVTPENVRARHLEQLRQSLARERARSSADGKRGPR